jgi:hypothetical protein
MTLADQVVGQQVRPDFLVSPFLSSLRNRLAAINARTHYHEFRWHEELLLQF